MQAALARHAALAGWRRLHAAAALASEAAGTGMPTGQQGDQGPSPGGTEQRSAAAGGGGGERPSAEDAAQEIVEKGSKRLMQSDDGREELRAGSFDLDRTAERVVEEGKKDASPQAAGRADDEEVRESVKSRVVAGSQTS